MTTAALVPYFLGRYLLGTATDRAGAELGEVRDRVGPGAHPKERVITADDYARAAASIVAWLRGRGVRRVAIEAPATSGASSERAARLVSGVVAALDAVGIVQGLLAGLLGIGGALLLRRYRIDRKELARIQAELAARAAAAGRLTG